MIFFVHDKMTRRKVLHCDWLTLNIYAKLEVYFARAMPMCFQQVSAEVNNISEHGRQKQSYVSGFRPRHFQPLSLSFFPDFKPRARNSNLRTRKRNGKETHCVLMWVFLAF